MTDRIRLNAVQDALDRAFIDPAGAAKIMHDLGIRGADTGQMHGPDRPAVIAERHDCPSCGASAGDPCRLPSGTPQGAIHVSRHRVAQRALWRALAREIDAGTGPIASIRYVR